MRRHAIGSRKRSNYSPSSAVAFKNLGACRLALSNFEGAETALKTAIRVQPNYLDGHLELVQFYTRRGEWALARETLAAAQRLSPDDPRVAELARRLQAVPSGGP